MNSENKFLYDGNLYVGAWNLPPEARELYEKNNSDGLLDIYFSSAKGVVNPAPKIDYNGRSYKSLDELPLETKEKLLGKLALLERQGLRLILNEGALQINNLKRNGSGSDAKFKEAPVAELSPGFRYRLILGLIILGAAIFFVYIFITAYLRNQ